MSSPVCCLCGETFQEGDIRLHVYEDRMFWSPAFGTYLGKPMKLEDGSDEKVMHPVCPLKLGAPSAMFGSDGSSIYV